VTFVIRLCTKATGFQ